jgi:transposase
MEKPLQNEEAFVLTEMRRPEIGIQHLEIPMEAQGEEMRVRRSQRDYSLPFKLGVIGEVEQGELTYKQAQRKYGIQGRSTVLTWLRKHGRLDWRSANPMKGKLTPYAQIRDLERRLKRLEAEKEVLNRAIDLADAQLKTDIRKKYLALLSKASKGQQGPAQDKAEGHSSGGKDVTASD